MNVTSLTMPSMTGSSSLTVCLIRHSAMLREPASSLWREFVMIGSTPTPSDLRASISSFSIEFCPEIQALLETMTATLGLCPSEGYDPRYSSSESNMSPSDLGSTRPCHGISRGGSAISGLPRNSFPRYPARRRKFSPVPLRR